ncbi:Lrp/AsnC family transcriptional regulator [Mucilaginibacter celer]|uniref:Winged helix-turn-helix transcriptional regulator n=1 Tax=Mucilaginibacter celer TaxID=2305508 RepID=A0A494VL19_9SPHI|nr:Lrp/AsnC family transcriptional regulator [Mucilaginibacter celer]AYL94201.1 winged helix-turn-helix transcriptional regulator [Mucilaginibacter celer]
MLKTEHRLDKIDLGILKLLEKDARLTHKEIAHAMSLSITPIHARIRKLQEEGYIRRYTAIVNHKMVGKGLIAYTQVQLKEHSQESLRAFMDATIKLPEVMECYHMTGAFDFLLRIAIRDMDEYNKVLIEKLSKLPDVGNMQSFFVMSEAKHETAYMFEGT